MGYFGSIGAAALARDRAAAQLVKWLKRDPVDLLVVGSHGHGLVRDLLYGQTVDKVRHGLEIPMLIARPDRATFSAENPRLAGIPAQRDSIQDPGEPI